MGGPPEQVPATYSLFELAGPTMEPFTLRFPGEPPRAANSVIVFAVGIEFPMGAVEVHGVLVRDAPPVVIKPLTFVFSGIPFGQTVVVAQIVLPLIDASDPPKYVPEP